MNNVLAWAKFSKKYDKVESFIVKGNEVPRLLNLKLVTLGVPAVDRIGYLNKEYEPHS